MRFFAGPTLLVIDELGYLPLPAEAASALFQVINQRYLKTSIVITTNRPVGAWGGILGDTTVAAAMLDRLLHRSVTITPDAAYYRLRNHSAASDEIRRITTRTNLREPNPATWGVSTSNTGEIPSAASTFKPTARNTTKRRIFRYIVNANPTYLFTKPRRRPGPADPRGERCRWHQADLGQQLPDLPRPNRT
jgi:hypothetical protein